MRGSSRRGSERSEVSLHGVTWSPAIVATLRHSTLPWMERAAGLPLAQLPRLGTRDRLSLVGQFAAHEVLLQFAGLPDSSFDPGQWAVIRRRGTDCRLIRIATQGAEPPPAPTQNLLRFAETIEAPVLAALQQSWTRAESVYAEVWRRLRADATADLRWIRSAAAGGILFPGPEALGRMWAGGGPHFVEETLAFRAMAALDPSTDLLVAGSEFPIQRYAGLASIDASLAGAALAPSTVADRLLERLLSKRTVLLVCGDLDDDSRRVLEMLRSARHAHQAGTSRRWFVLSTRIAAQRVMEDYLARAGEAGPWLDSFLESEHFDPYLLHGVMPVDDGAFMSTPEPRRSYLAALALLGTRIPRSLARDFLAQFFFEQPLEDLVVDGLTSLDGEAFVFVSDSVRAFCARHIPESSRAALCRAAAAVAEPVRSGLLLIECGDRARGTERLESVGWQGSQQIVTILGSIPPHDLSPSLAATLGEALIDEGRYGDARQLAPLLLDAQRDLLLARCDRRTGDYANALERLERMPIRSFPAGILRLELLRLAGRTDEARRIDISAQTHEDAVRLAYERALLDLESGHSAGPAAVPADHYYGTRLATYRALLERDFDRAEAGAEQSRRAARCATERIDADLDRVFASFSAGRWDGTRAIALEALATVDETQGDRAAAGVLFTLTFVEADDGRWSAAAEHIERLRRHYTSTADPHRLVETDLLSGYLEFSRARFPEARRLTESLLAHDLLPQIREAAALIVDEISWIEGGAGPLRSTGQSRNREFDDRHRLLRRQRGLAVDSFHSPFMRELSSWSLVSRAQPPAAATRSERLRLLRVALAIGRMDVAQQLAGELLIALPSPQSNSLPPDISMLRLAATADYPFRPDTFSLPWCYASRNRLGHWAQEGSRRFEVVQLDRALSSTEPDWLSCSDRERLYVEGCGSWPEPARQALASLFRTRAEHYRLRRVLEQEESVLPASPAARGAEGIVGQSPAMRSVFTLVEKIGARDVPVCVLGESGTGKELVGRAIHQASPRRNRTFTALNCAALPENLVESELFGHVRGAFTGADRDRPGVIETTDGGTLFLDEIGEMPLAAQAKLLRFLQDGEFRRLGEAANRSADVRLVSATNRKLETAVEEGRFREDLYYRVRGVDVVLPPLRDRGADILLLARHFLARERARHRAGPQLFTSDVETLFESYDWPGNVRELQNTIRAAHAVAGEGRQIDLEHLPERLRNTRPRRVAAGSYQDAVTRFRRDLIEKSLLEAAGNQNRAAALLKISRQALAYQIRELGIMVGKSRPRPRV